LRERGVLVGRGGRHGSVLILAPPLVIEEDALAGGLDAIVAVLAGQEDRSVSEISRA
jgi:4-aminobutyrate aminotransferase-like enzyme